MAAQVDTLRLLAQPDLTENRLQGSPTTKEIKKKHSSRPVGGVEMGSRGGEDSHCSVGQMAQAVRALADPATPHLHR